MNDSTNNIENEEVDIRDMDESSNSETTTRDVAEKAWVDGTKRSSVIGLIAGFFGAVAHIVHVVVANLIFNSNERLDIGNVFRKEKRHIDEVANKQRKPSDARSYTEDKNRDAVAVSKEGDNAREGQERTEGSPVVENAGKPSVDEKEQGSSIAPCLQALENKGYTVEEAGKTIVISKGDKEIGINLNLAKEDKALLAEDLEIFFLACEPPGMDEDKANEISTRSEGLAEFFVERSIELNREFWQDPEIQEAFNEHLLNVLDGRAQNGTIVTKDMLLDPEQCYNLLRSVLDPRYPEDKLRESANELVEQVAPLMEKYLSIDEKMQQIKNGAQEFERDTQEQKNVSEYTPDIDEQTPDVDEQTPDGQVHDGQNRNTQEPSEIYEPEQDDLER